AAAAEQRVSTAYRQGRAEGFCYQCFVHVAAAVNATQVTPARAAAGQHTARRLSIGSQEYTEYPELFPLTKPIIKRAAFVQTTGEVKYTQDVQLPVGGFHASMVKSSRPHARFSFTKKAAGLDALQALLKQQYPDFQAFITVADIPEVGQNLIGLGEDDPVFSDGVVTS